MDLQGPSRTAANPLSGLSMSLDLEVSTGSIVHQGERDFGQILHHGGHWELNRGPAPDKIFCLLLCSPASPVGAFHLHPLPIASVWSAGYSLWQWTARTPHWAPHWGAIAVSSPERRSWWQLRGDVNITHKGTIQSTQWIYLTSKCVFQTTILYFLQFSNGNL